MTAGRLFQHVYGVDFSGAKLAGENTWIARLTPAPLKSDPHRLRLTTFIDWAGRETPFSVRADGSNAKRSL